MELTENMEEFLNDLIGKRMEQVYQENDGDNSDLNEFYYRMGLRDGLKLKETIKTILDTLME